MSSLVLCPCAHGLEVHEPAGCRGDRNQSCPCQLSEIQALDAAIDNARSEYAAKMRAGSAAHGLRSNPSA